MKRGYMPNGDSIATATLAVRIYRIADRRGWDMTLTEIADELGESVNRVKRVAQIKGWLPRLRTTVADRSSYAGLVFSIDEDLERMGAL